MKLLVILVPFYFFIPIQFILAQDVLLSLSHEEITCDQGGSAVVEFQVDNWEDVGGVSGTIEWNELELSFVHLEEFFPSGGTFLADTSTVSSGYLTFNWFNSEGTDLPDGSVVMEIDFEVINDDLPAVHPVDFSDDPTELEVVKIDQNYNVTAAPFTIDNGSVTVLDVDPELDCLTDLMLELDENGEGELNVSDFIISTSYACGTVDTTASQTLFTCADLGLQIVTITAEGSNGQSSTCQVEVEVFTDDDPELECIATA
nr:hypothetical protein [Saprospiraceae bacterium]